MVPPNTSQTQTPKTNWLATPDSEEFGKLLAGKLDELTRGESGALHYGNVSIAYTHLYGFDVEGVGANAALVTRSGDQGSIAELRIPAAAGLLTKVWNLVVGPELAWTTIATTTDFASEARALTARNALTYYWNDKAAGTIAKGAAFEALAFGEAALHIPWDPDAGEDVATDGDRIVRSGDIAYRLVSTWDIVRDPTARSWDSMAWVIVREWKNRYDLATTCEDPETAEACLSAEARTQAYWRPFDWENSDSDLIPVYYLYHQRTASVPSGRQTVFLESGAVLSDSELDRAYWKQLPVVRMAAGEYSGTPWPYSKFFAILGAQQASDGLYRDLLTNATATSGGLIWTEDNGDTPVPQLGGGPKVLVGAKDSKPPQPLNLQQSHPEHFNLVGRLRNEAQQIMGIDNLTAGEEVGANLSGAAMALLTSTSVQNNSQLQAAWAKFVQTVGTVTLAHIQHHMAQPRRIVLAGSARSSLVTSTELSGAAIEGVERVQVELGSAMQQTAAGRFELATMMLDKGWAQTPQQLQTVLDTGRLDALTQDLSNELMLINDENEALSRGEDVPVMLDDDHVLHLKMHRPVTASLTARRDPKVVAAQQAHQDAHIRVLRETDPSILQLFGQPVVGQPAANDNVEGVPANDNQEPLQEQAQKQAPSLPKDPKTGEQAGPAAGELPPALAVKPKTGTGGR